MSLQYHLSDGLNVLLDKIKFVDRIVFGRLHYNKLVSSYKEYYNECASIIMDFCKRNNIDCHIKNKTITKE